MGDIVNALVTLLSVGLIAKSITKAQAEESSKGIYWGQPAWHALKSVWSIVYYTRLNQPYSMLTSILFLVVSAIYTARLLRYKDQ
ncbi:hypothetical protein LCGC14_2483500 [marine sediment metagenome]|uniref:Uncharacterized protein n=1 Tax=marine sediment metagenome TaxID=412755 RepID=A0A0F9BUM6_9ZZZZ